MSTPRVTIIVPARLASTRLPEKVLLARTGRPMAQHVVEQAAMARCGRLVVVATDSVRVVEALRSFGTTCLLTSPDHPNGTSRLAEAATLLGLGDDEVVVNAQGDEPEMPGAVIDAAAGALLSGGAGGSEANVGTVCTPLAEHEDPANPNIVKVVRALAAGGDRGAGVVRMDGDGVIAPALYFSRANVPVVRDAGGVADLGTVMRHVGVYAYRVGFLRRYAVMPQTPLERAESLEQLRVLEHGLSIGVARCDAACGLTGIDTPEQYEGFVARHRAQQGSQQGSQRGSQREAQQPPHGA
jgi:3-deoxy-manno-octulosonate cytidylyltransferase (CMP-KDO synthetase)